jgi:NADH:ubiquinone oxidoreductase subunit E
MQKELNKEEILSILDQFQPQKEFIINALHELQNKHPQHYLSEEILNFTSKYFNITKGQLFGIVTYYSMFSVTPRGKYLIRLCKSPVCQMMGSAKLVDYLKSNWQLEANLTSQDGLFTLELCECLGRCGKAPSMIINEEVFTDLNLKKLEEILLNIKQTEL